MIRFAAPHALRTGDPVIYVPAAGTNVVAPGTYYVRKIDDLTIALYTSQALATVASTPISPGNAVGDTITLNGHGFAERHGAHVRSRPDPTSFSGRAVNTQPNPDFDEDD